MVETLTLANAGDTGGVDRRQAGRVEPDRRHTTLVVDNMVCGGCMRKIESALCDVAGVMSVRANLSARRVMVVGAADRADPQALIDALANIGFRAAELHDDTPADTAIHERDLQRRLAVAGFAAANIMLFSVSVWSSSAGDMGETVRQLFHWLSATIALPTVAYAGQPFFRSAVAALRSRRLNMDVPISLGVLLATAMSVYQTTRGSEQIYFDAAVTLLFFLLLGRFLDARMRKRTQGAAANLLGLRAMAANVIGPNGGVETIAARALEPGMRILVATGERIAADGRVVQGDSAVDEAIITGETVPRPVTAGSDVYAGSINTGQSLVVAAKATDDNTLLAEIGRLMSAAEQGRGRYLRLADRAAAIYAPAVHVLGLATFIAWLALGASWQAALTAAIAVLIVTCPCALALAVPAVQVAAAGRLFDRGVIVKAADGLERLAEIDTVVFDKTGTLTLGRPRLADIIDGDEHDLAAAAALAVASRHPYARAVVAAANANSVDIKPAANVRETPGRGLSVEAPDGSVVRLGSSRWCNIQAPGNVAKAALWLCRPGRDAVGFAFEDALRPDADTVVRRLVDAGFMVEMLSGDRITAVGDVAAQLALKRWRGHQSPADKIARINALKEHGRKVLMVGDGLNDAPALAAANASLSPATAADISQTTADAIFQGDELDAVVETIAVARACRNMALQNFAIALAYNAVFVPLAMAGVVTPLLAAIAMSASSIAVTANALRLRVQTLRI